MPRWSVLRRCLGRVHQVSFPGTQPQFVAQQLQRLKMKMEIFVVVVHLHTFRYLSDILNSLRQLGHTAFDYRSRPPLASVFENS